MFRYTPAVSFQKRSSIWALAALLGFGLADLSVLADVVPGDQAEFTLIHTHWGVQDGLPINSVTGLAQDESGYLWVATLNGLVRFNGLQFDRVESNRSDSSTSQRYTTLHRTPDGKLWLTTEQGDLVRYAKGEFKHITRADGLSNDAVFRIAVSPDGWLAIGTRKGVSLIRKDGIKRLTYPSLAAQIYGISWPAGDRLWVATSREIFRVDHLDTHPEFRSWPINSDPIALQENGGRLWIGTTKGLFELTSEGPERRFAKLITSQVGRMGISGNDLYFEAMDDIWRLHGDDLRRVAPSSGSIGRAPLLATDNRGEVVIVAGKALWQDEARLLGLEREVIAVLRDKEGSLWLGTSGNGLYQIRRSALRVLGQDQGLPGNNVYPVFQAQNGDIWAGFLGEGAVRISAAEGVSALPAMPSVWSIAEVDGEIWLAGDHICRVTEADSCTEAGLEELESSAPFQLVYQDARGRVWVGGRNGAMWLRENGRWHHLGPAEGWTVTHPIRAVQESPDGSLWFGTNGAGVVRFRDGVFTRLDVAWGLNSDSIRSLFLLDSNTLLAGTEDRGLCRILIGTETPRPGGCLDRRQGFPSDSVHHMEIDGDDRLWWSSNRGIFWLNKAKLQATFSGTLAQVPPVGRVGKQQGMSNPEANGGCYPAGLKDDSGQFWFPTQEGLVLIRPELFKADSKAPTARIDSIQGKAWSGLPGSTPVRLPVGERTAQIDLSSTTFLDPTHVEYRYRQPGLSPEWFSLGTSRLASLAQRHPGKVLIEFSARVPGGAWQSEPTKVELDIPPYWWEHRLVQWLAVALTLLLFWGAVRWRQQRLSQRAVMLQTEVDERTRELKEINDRRSEFFAQVSHELRTPLTLLLGPLEDTEATGDAPSREDLSAMARSSRRLKRLVDQILDLQKIDALEMKLSKKPVDLGAFLRRCIEPFAVLGSRVGIEVMLLEGDPVTVSLDEAQFEKVIGNLLSNAFKASPSGARVEVTVGWSNGRVRVEVLDRGPGLAPGAEQRIFKRFHQEASPGHRVQEGTGIGLALVKELVELHGGRVVASNRPGGGARFAFELEPLAESPLDDRTETIVRQATLVTRPEGSVKRTESRPEDVTLLVVEDNADLRAYIERILVPHFRVLLASDGKKGLGMAESHLPDLIISDIMMPRMGGIELLQQLRLGEETCAIPVLFLTARGSEEQEIEGLEKGADDYLVKPFSALRLLARVRAVLASRERLRDALRGSRKAISGGRRNSLLERAQDQILEHIDDPDFGVEELASSLAMSRSKLFRLLKGEYGVAARDLIRELRLEEAARLLGTRAGTVSEVCLAVGFPNLASFSRAFSQKFGLPPSRYPAGS
jgi:signal transduction histidine kinase/ligand-binding sensor domain-containing protein/AraC-like DNA-binding protein